jgi:peptide/nickel transport system substrate-binding protein
MVKRNKLRLFKTSLVFFSAIVLVLTLLACGKTTQENGVTTPGSTEPKYGGTLRIAQAGDTNTLDPAFSLSPPDHFFTELTHDNLVWQQRDLTLKPMLATAWEPNDDLTEWTIHLREGVKFHHGKLFNADDVVFTFERLIDPATGSPGRAALESISSVTKVDEYTVRFNLKNPDTFLPDTLSIYQARILPSDVDPARFATEEFGTGPFICEEYLPGERSVFKRNPDYWMAGLPYLDGVIFYYMPEPDARAEALKTASVDVLAEVQAVSVSGLESYPGIVISEVPSATYINLAMIETIPPFNNKLVRQAFQAATNREAILQVALFGRGIIGNDTTIPPFDPHYDNTQPIPPYDIEKAKSLLAQAGYPNGIDVTLHTSSVSVGMDETAVAFKESAAPAGIRVTIERHPEDVYWSNVWMVEPFTMVSWNGRPPDQALSIVYLSDAPWNETGIKNPELDALIIKARGQLTVEERKKTYAEVQRILIDDASRIIPVFRPVFVGMRDNVRGVEAHPSTWIYLQEAWLSD